MTVDNSSSLELENERAGQTVSQIEATLLQLPQSSFKAFNDFKVLFLEQLLAVKSFFVYYIFMQTVAPLALIFAMGHYTSYIPDSTQLTRFIGGAVTFALVTVGLTTLAQKLCYMREQGTLLYYSSLPIHKATFILAMLFSSLVILLPSVITPIVSGMVMYNLKLTLNLWLPLVGVVGALSLVSLGTVLGVVIKNYQMVSLVCNLFIILMTFASPTFLAAELLPLPLQLLGWVLPSTYISDALTRCLLGNYDTHFFVDLAFLVIVGLAALFLTARFLHWEAD